MVLASRLALFQIAVVPLAPLAARCSGVELWSCDKPYSLRIVSATFVYVVSGLTGY